MTEQIPENNNDLQIPDSAGMQLGESDAASKSLSDAFRVSFVILKVIMAVLVILFLLSGFETVDYGETALVMRFGKIRTKDGVLKSRSRPYWIMPYPIEEIVKIPDGKSIDVAVNSFWYHQTRDELLAGEADRVRPPRPELRPELDGYCLTRSQSRTTEVDGMDYNIVHSKWQARFKIGSAREFFRNVHVDNAKPGEVYFDVITRSVTPMLENLIEDAVVTALVNYTVDDVTSDRADTVAGHVKQLLQQRLNELQSGMEVEIVNMTEKTWPRQVDQVFQYLISASQTSQTMKSEARSYAENKLIEAEAKAEERIAEARAYRTNVVETASANAEYLKQILPEYRKRPKLVIEEIYLKAIENILSSVDEQFIIESTDELRLLLSRDTEIKPESETESEQGN